MAKARAIVKRRKAVRNIRKITKTMQMIATAKFQKSLKRAVNTKPFTMKVRELAREVAAGVGPNVEHPLLRTPTAEDRQNRIAILIITANRGLAGAYNGNVLRTAVNFYLKQRDTGVQMDAYVAGKKGITAFNFRKWPITQKVEVFDEPRYAQVEPLGNEFIRRFTGGELDAVYVVYMNFISTGVQRPEVMTLLPLAGVQEAADHLGQQVAEKEAQIRKGALDATRGGQEVKAEELVHGETIYDFSPAPEVLLEELLPVTVKTALFQTFLDATTSEHVARMVAMKSTTELSEIMGGVEAMKK
jgi:F-type H+-transporting ATPase subunit gamma